MAKQKAVEVKAPSHYNMKMVYDVKSVPEKLGIANMIKISEQHRVVFWDSDAGTAPKFYGVLGDELPMLVVDTKDQKIDFEQYQRDFEDKVFWDKEFYNATHSPIYYWTNYGTPVWPANDAGIKKFLASLGMQDIPTTDSAKARKAWEKQKEQVALAMKFVTVDHLKERKAVLDTLRAQHEQNIAALELMLKSYVDLFNAKGEPLEPKKRISNLVGKINFQGRVPAKWDLYRNKKRKWDMPMLYSTDYETLLKIAYDLFEDRISDGSIVGPSTENLAGVIPMPK